MPNDCEKQGGRFFVLIKKFNFEFVSENFMVINILV